MTIQKINSVTSESWYCATQELPEYKGNFAKALGFGSTPDLAIADCMRDIEKVEQLQAKLK